MLSVTEDGHLIVRNFNEAVPIPILVQLFALQQTRTKEASLAIVREALVPEGYQPFPFQRNRPESYLDSLRSTLATFLYRKAVADWSEAGVDFSSHLYVPEIDSVTNKVHHERGDHCHILKRMATHTRELRYIHLSGDAFDAAMTSPDTGLTHAALVGLRKQSVDDAERLLSHRVGKFLGDNGFATEAEYVTTIADWHEASDGRGLSQLQRSKKNYAMLNYVLDELMPWHRQTYDFALLDINR